MDPALIFILIFILAPLIERLLKASRQQQPPPQGRLPRERPEPFPHQRQEQQRQQPAERQTEAEGETSAADMLPDDLWEILTGQKRPRPVPPPPPEPAREEAPRERTPYEVPPAPRPRTAEPVGRQGGTFERQQAPAKTGRRKLPKTQTRPLPGVESRERRLPPVPMRSGRLSVPEERRRASRPGSPADDYIREIPVHEAPQVVSLEELVIDDEQRHARFHQRLAGLDAPAIVRRPAPTAMARLFRDESEVRRAIVMSEILGPPKAFE